ERPGGVPRHEPGGRERMSSCLCPKCCRVPWEAMSFVDGSGRSWCESCAAAELGMKAAPGSYACPGCIGPMCASASSEAFVHDVLERAWCVNCAARHLAGCRVE